MGAAARSKCCLCSALTLLLRLRRARLAAPCGSKHPGREAGPLGVQHCLRILLPSTMQAWGNKLLWGYDTDDDPALQAAFNAAVRQQNPFDNSRVFFDTGDSYGTGKLEGRAEVRARFRAS